MLLFKVFFDFNIYYYFIINICSMFYAALSIDGWMDR